MKRLKRRPICALASSNYARPASFANTATRLASICRSTRPSSRARSRRWRSRSTRIGRRSATASQFCRWKAGTARLDGRPTELTRRRWQRFGLSGAKLIWGGEAVAVRHDGRANPNQLMLNETTVGDLAELRARFWWTRTTSISAQRRPADRVAVDPFGALCAPANDKKAAGTAHGLSPPAARCKFRHHRRMLLSDDEIGR